ncbi:hypothetical protein CB0940_09417 [Cercospora beticola]|uniref:Uncharacterized protein n=1 Tax=Cercospora beticola TaxID=122368 RepID=A0A2G5HHZ8_CERBT|nr:hypothetical protein CB0940_09417 [Cercospora beticola]PIA92194.1 hypothetical protein CB0940_09417 [Cercospora beticola]WPB06267.1 hypothetical protein RHO25_010924 [Cercospora beticola]CAK1366155.1 unnamed protein product [Cercospora beticola]
MASAARIRRMDDFIINPTMSADAHIEASDMAWAKSQLVMPGNNKGKQPMSEPHESFDFWPTYTSDEEEASPVDDDSASEYSVCSEISVAEVFEVQHLRCAQLVLLQNAGKARMIEMSKAARSPRSSLSSRSSKAKSIDIPRPNLSLRMPLNTRTSQDSTGSSSRNASLSSTTPESPLSTAPSSVYDEMEDEVIAKRKQNRVSHIDLMHAVRDLPQTPITPISPAPLPVARKLSTNAPSTKSVRRKRNFASGFASKFGRRDPSEDTMESVLDRVARAEGGLTLQRQGAQHRYSGGRPKLVARAANERAPPIVLPPFPGE